MHNHGYKPVFVRITTTQGLDSISAVCVTVTELKTAVSAAFTVATSLHEPTEVQVLLDVDVFAYLATAECEPGEGITEGGGNSGGYNGGWW